MIRLLSQCTNRTQLIYSKTSFNSLNTWDSSDFQGHSKIWNFPIHLTFSKKTLGNNFAPSFCFFLGLGRIYRQAKIGFK